MYCQQGTNLLNKIWVPSKHVKLIRSAPRRGRKIGEKNIREEKGRDACGFQGGEKNAVVQCKKTGAQESKSEKKKHLSRSGKSSVAAGGVIEEPGKKKKMYTHRPGGGAAHGIFAKPDEKNWPVILTIKESSPDRKKQRKKKQFGEDRLPCGRNHHRSRQGIG